MDHDDFDGSEPCHSCDGEGRVLGQLGRRVHLVCRACGQQWSYLVQPAEPVEAA